MGMLKKLRSMLPPSESMWWRCNEAAKEEAALKLAEVSRFPTLTHNAAASCKHHEEYKEVEKTIRSCLRLCLAWYGR